MAGAKQAAQNQTKKWRKLPSFAWGGIKGAFSETAIEQGRTAAESWMTKGGKSPFGYAQRLIGNTAVRSTLKSEQNRYALLKSQAEKGDLMTNASRYQSASTLGKLAIIAQAAQNGSLGKLAKKANITPEEALKLQAASIHLRDEDTQKAIERHFVADNGEAFGAIAQKLGKYTIAQQTSDRVNKGYESYTDKIIAEAKDEKAIKQLGPALSKEGEAFSGQIRNLHKSINKFWQGKQIEQAVSTLGKKFADSFQANAKPPQWYLQPDENTGRVRNAGQAFYLTSTAAQKSGIGFRENVSLKELKKELIKNQKIAQETGENTRAKAREKGGFINPEPPHIEKNKPNESKTHWWNHYQET